MMKTPTKKPLYTNNSRKYAGLPMHRKGTPKTTRKRAWEDICAWYDWTSEK